MKLAVAFVLTIGLFLIGRPITEYQATFVKEAIKNKFFKIAVISDLNSGYGSTVYHPDVAAALKAIDSIKPDLILCAGDMVAGQKASLTEQNLTDMWQSFGANVFSPIKAMKVPFAFTVGNHDASANFKKDRAATQKFWNDHQEELGLNFIDKENFPFYYSYTKNDVFFISWDAASSTIQAEVYKWMEKQLSSEKAKKAKLRILLGHLPIYAIVDSKNKPGEVLASTKETVDFFKRNNVNLYVSGHQHAYYPARDGSLRLLNTGCIGEGPRKLIGDSTLATRAYTIIEIPIKSYKDFTYRTFIPNKNIEMKLSELPDSIIGFNGISKRERN
ncbi:metallophosphoesterase family protein [Pedobacter boryungensis]|uniref:Metallophosphoesterase n=1 Tax=Pedobacter boryungensis TaxID=869962 RepID=A0ABX2DDC5_9SPHI|nr:metallophosphoesterase [Pedobacter boryungensis]NQX32103.1 metallophosphoesterase [Pedobacter boryungensis]